MLDILEAILYGDNMDLLGKRPLEAPCTVAEQQFLAHLQRVEPETAALLRQDVRVLAQERHDDAFQSGVCFGAQLAFQLMEGF